MAFTGLQIAYCVFEFSKSEYVVTSDVGWVNTQWVGKYFLGIYPGIYLRLGYPKTGYFEKKKNFLKSEWAINYYPKLKHKIYIFTYFIHSL